jgi:hypothetical protein
MKQRYRCGAGSERARNIKRVLDFINRSGYKASSKNSLREMKMKMFLILLSKKKFLRERFTMLKVKSVQQVGFRKIFSTLSLAFCIDFYASLSLLKLKILYRNAFHR